MMTKIKNEGQVFTPPMIVSLILSQVGYEGENVLTKKIMEPSFGDGAFLVYIIDIIASQTKSPELAKEIILNNVFGIEKDPILYQKAMKNIQEVLDFHHITDIDLSSNLICENTLSCYKQFRGMFDYVVGNPPYVRIHNITDKEILKEFKFSSGNTDLYVLFYELGLTMLNDTGKLGFITPSSFLKNTSQKSFRNHLINSQYLDTLIDFKSFKIFETVDTYTCICILNKCINPSVQYIECKNYRPISMSIVNNSINRKTFNEMFYDKSWTLSTEQDMQFMENVRKQPVILQDVVCVQNGIATLRDSIYIGAAWEDEKQTIPYMGKHTDINKLVYFNGMPIETNILHRCVKASKFDGTIINQYIIYPYVDTLPMTEELLKTQYPYAYQYLLNNKNELMKRDMEANKDWFLFGRSQGIINSNKPKLTFKHIIHRESYDINVYLLDEDVIVYSGLFITGDNLNQIQEVLETCDFTRYCIISGKYMSGGYVSVSAKNVKEYRYNPDKLYPWM